MEEEIWACDKCNSTEVSQEHSALVPMNENPPDIGELLQNDYYWCFACDGQCNPVKRPKTKRV